MSSKLARGIFAENLRRLCEAFEVSPGRLAAAASLPEADVNAMLAGEHGPDLDQLAALARALEVDPDSLLEPGTND